jgi:hypothetical protein
LFITAENGGVARVKGVAENEKKSTTKCKSQRRLDEMTSVTLVTLVSHLQLQLRDFTGGGVPPPFRLGFAPNWSDSRMILVGLYWKPAETKLKGAVEIGI